MRAENRESLKGSQDDQNADEEMMRKARALGSKMRASSAYAVGYLYQASETDPNRASSVTPIPNPPNPAHFIPKAA